LSLALFFALGRLLPGITRGLLALLHKSGDRPKLITNWRLITLLNISYKLFAKVLQKRVQPVLMEIISPDQAGFLPMRFILDNIILMHETMECAASSNQPLVFLKVDFSKAFDMVDWLFLFRAMAQLGFPMEFIDMTKMLFEDVAVSVKVNGSNSTLFKICRGVRQGCLMAPYLFLLWPKL
jgi:hypothetical protein